MAEFKLPDMGEDIEDAEVLKVLVSRGDRIEREQAVLELETDKATFEVPSSVAGTVGEVHVSEGDRVRAGQTIFTVEEGEAPEAEGAEAEEKEAESRKEKKGPEAETERGPEEGDEEAQTGEPEEEREEKAEEGRARRKTTPARKEPAGGEAEEPEEDEEGEKAPRAKKKPARRTSEKGEVPAGPATRRLARELGVDLRQVAGRGPGGRVTADDVKAAVRRGPSVEGRTALPDFERWGPVERRRLTAIERAAVEPLSTAWRTVPHVTQHDEADVTELETMRRRFEEARRSSDPKLTATALVIKAVVAALHAYPRVNASLDMESEELVVKRYVHIGVAVDTDDGLLVPVVRDADRKTTRQIAAEIAGLAERARKRKLTRDEMQGASFTVTNLGGIGGTSFTPVVPHPQVAILGVSRVREEAVVRAGEIVARLVMPLSLSYDHRAINGADAARFTRHVASLLEDPLRLLAES
jgi:pyruvate dehydrogenase E2 component (dihydrolipoamide acetyltransferase)